MYSTLNNNKNVDRFQIKPHPQEKDVSNRHSFKSEPFGRRKCQHRLLCTGFLWQKRPKQLWLQKKHNATKARHMPDEKASVMKAPNLSGPVGAVQKHMPWTSVADPGC